MVVAGPRHVTASSAFHSKGKHVQQSHERQRPNDRASTDCISDMRDPRPTSATSNVTEMFQVKGNAEAINYMTSLKCPPTTFAFVYGTLKRGFGNYWLMESLMAKGHARFLGTTKTKQKFPMVCGPYQVPFLIDIPSSGHQVLGEFYEVDRRAVERLDELEGVSKGHYVRRSVVLSDLQLQPSVGQDFSSEIVAQAYFAAPTYASELAQAPHIEAFTEKESATYVRRKDRPQNRTFLQHIEHWIETRQVVRAN